VYNISQPNRTATATAPGEDFVPFACGEPLELQRRLGRERNRTAEKPHPQLDINATTAVNHTHTRQ